MTTSQAEARSAPPSPILKAVLCVFLPFASGYFLSYLFRNVNAVIAPRLVEELQLSAADLGLLTAAYFFAFAAFQIPLGLLLDRFGPRRVQACLFLVAASGATVFALGDSRLLLMLGRALIGAGVAGGLMSSFKAITLWFPQARWPLVNGCFLSMGSLGAISATAPVEALLHVADWRELFAGLAVASFCVSLLILLVVPERRDGPKPSSLRDSLRGLGQVYGDRLFWRLAPLGAICAGTAMAIQGLWAGPWFRDVGGFDPAAVANHLLMVAIAMAVGSTGIGAVADLLGRFGIGLGRIVAGGLLLLMLAESAIVLEVAPQSILPWLLFGLMLNSPTLIYPLLSRHFTAAFAGRSNTGLNVFVFALAFSAQYGIGGVIDLWPLADDGGYRPEAYTAAFGCFLGLQALAYLWFLLGRAWRDAPPARSDLDQGEARRAST